MEGKKQNTPLLSAMLQYAAENVVPFHTPGHKLGRGIHEKMGQLMGEKALSVDLGLMYELDDFHSPTTCIKEAQDLAAALYGAEESFFLVNGTTGGIQAMIMAAAGPGEKIIVPRNAHRSVLGGIVLSGAIPVFLPPEIDEDLGIAMGIATEKVKICLEEHSDAKALLMVHPTYYGVASDLKTITDIAHAKGIPVLVDEAHGPHLLFSEGLPMDALTAGADVVAQSTHKILGAVTQASMLHCQGNLINRVKLRKMLQIVQTTSPNYWLLASLDAARAQMELEGSLLMGQAVVLAERLRKEINDIDGLYAFGREKIGRPGVYDLDPTKVTVSFERLGLTGGEAEVILRRQYAIQAELTDARNVLFIVTLGDRDEDINRLIKALQGLARQFAETNRLKGRERIPLEFSGQLTIALTPREALFRPLRQAEFKAAAGMICGETICFYPPGIPVVYPGERLSQEVIDYCREMQALGLRVSGTEDTELITVKVVE